MITGLSTQNFKSWQDSGMLQLAPLTGFFGANNSGKTSLLQILLLLKQTAERQPPGWNETLYYGDDESLVNLGDFEVGYPPTQSNISVAYCNIVETVSRNKTKRTLNGFG